MEGRNKQIILIPRVAVRFDRDKIRESLPSMKGLTRSLFETFLTYLDERKDHPTLGKFTGSIVAPNHESPLKYFEFEKPIEGFPVQISVEFVSGMTRLR